jgi:hypothetical protein
VVVVPRCSGRIVALGTVGVGGPPVGGVGIDAVDGDELLGAGTRYGLGSGVRVGGLA